MADETGSANVEAVEADVEEARARFARTIDRLTSPETVDATKKEVTDIAQGYKDEVLKHVQAYKDEFLGTARSRGQGFVDDLKQRALNNPLPVLLIGAGIAYRLYKKPPVTTLLVGAGAALLMRSGGGATESNRGAHWDPYRAEDPDSYVPGGVAGYGYPVEASAPGSSTTEQIGAAAAQVGERAREIGARARDAAYTAGARIRETASEAGAQLSATATQVGSAASDMWDETASGIGGAAEDVGDRTASVLETVQRNPLALGALGIAAGLALGRSLRATEAGNAFVKTTADALGRGSREVASRARSAAAQALDAAGSAVSNASAAASDLADTVASQAPDLASGVTDAAGRAAETVRGLAPSPGASRPGPRGLDRGRAGSHFAGHRSAGFGDGLEEQISDLAERYPLLLGAIGIVLGAALGGSLERTDAENRLLGATSDRLKERARELAMDRYEEAIGRASNLADHLTARLADSLPEGPQPGAKAQPSDFETVLGGGKPPSEAGSPAGGRPSGSGSSPAAR